jgi:hypothetical protein
MTKADVVVGGYYFATVSGNRTVVQIVAETSYGKGWDAVNMSTQRTIRIKTGGRLEPVFKSRYPDPTKAANIVAELVAIYHA